MPGNPLTDPNWATEVTDRIVTFIDQVRSQTTTKVVYAARAAVFGILGVMLGLFIVVLVLIAALRGLQSLLELATTWERAVYLSYLILGAILSIAGLVLFRLRNSTS
jgi:uncharacterized membrane protein